VAGSVLFFLSCRTTGFLLLFLFAAPLGASFLAVATPLVTPLHPLRLRISICRDQHRCRYCDAYGSRQAQKRKSPSTRNQFKFDAFTHLSLLIYPKAKIAPEDDCRPIGLGANVRFGSKADICAATSDVRFTPHSDRESRHASNGHVCFSPESEVCADASSERKDPDTDCHRRRSAAAQ